MEAVGLSIDENHFTFWSEVEITFFLDGIATVALSAPFHPDREDFRELFRPFSYKPIRVTVGSGRGNVRTIFRGTMVGVHPDSGASESRVEITGYATPAVLADCPPPGDSVPLEFDGLGLRAIAESLAAPFGVAVECQVDDGAKFDRVAIETEQQIFSFLAELAKQRNLVLSNTSEGALLCWRSVAPGAPVGRLVEGEPPLGRVSASFSPQQYFSEVTAFAPARPGRSGGRYTQPNPFLRDRLRPMSFKVDDTDPADAPAAARAKLGRMFGAMASYTVEDLPGWRDPRGALWRPNTTLLLSAPSAMIYQESELLIRSVTFRQDASTETASLELVLPGAYSGGVPETLPWSS